MEDLVENSEGVVTKVDEVYFIHKDLTLSDDDKITITENITIKFHESVQFIINGNNATLLINPDKEVVFTAHDTNAKYGVIEIREASVVFINNALFEYGSGIKVIDSDFKITNSTIQKMDYTSSTYGAISCSYGRVYIENCKFLNNVRSGINSSANARTTLTILNNYFYNNVTENSNRPQINIGPCLEGDTTRIIGNTIIGNKNDKAGGLGCVTLWLYSHYLIEGNTIKDNRYGITIAGSNMRATIRDNIIADNNLETNPDNGGSV